MGAWVITMNAARHMVSDATVVVRDGAILAVESSADALRDYPDVPVVGGPDCVVTPGYINCHQHLTGDRLMASAIPDDLPPGAALVDWVLPGHAVHTPEDDEISATIACIAALRRGITYTVEAGTVAHPDSVAAAMNQAGMSGSVSTWGWDTPDQPFAAEPSEVLDRQSRLLERWPADGLVAGRVALVGHDLMSDELLTGASELARTTRSGLTFHISPSDSDPAAYLARTGVRPLVHFDNLGVLGEHLLLAHAVHLDDREVELVLSTRTAVAYTPWAYLRLGQGVATAGRHAEMWRRGARIGLGCDSENAGDAVDPLRAAALAAGLGKEQLGDATGFGAHDALEMLTVGGADAVGMGDRIGSIEPGKRADLVVHSREGAEWQPHSPDPVLQLVWASGGAAVSDVVVGGRVVVTAGRCVLVDEAEWFEAGAAASGDLLRRAGVTGLSRWPAVGARPSRD